MANETFAMTVSDVLDVPLRGQLLRLRVARGQPDAGALAIGRKLRVRSGGIDHVVRIVDHSITGGNVSQKRLEKYKEFDALIAPVEGSGSLPIDFGAEAEPVGD